MSGIFRYIITKEPHSKTCHEVDGDIGESTLFAVDALGGGGLAESLGE